MKKGFTLIELLVVMSIVGLITTGAILSVARSKHITSLNRAAREVLLVARDAQNKALITQEGGSDVVPCGYGIHDNADGKSFIIFREEPSPTGEDCIATSTPEQNIDRLYQGPGGYGVDVIVEEVSLTEDNYVKIDNNFVDVYFEPPDGLTYIDGVHDNQVASSTEIVLCLRGDCTDFRKSVRIYLGGNIEVMDVD